MEKLESLITHQGEGSIRWMRDQMTGAPEIAPAFRGAGSNVICVANNHAVRRGSLGFHNTLKHLPDAEWFVAGLRGTLPWTSEPVILTVRNARIGILANFWRPRQCGMPSPLYTEGSVELAIADIQRVRAQCDSSLYSGEEVSGERSSETVLIGDALLAGGANAIVGYHPRSVRPIKISDSGVVAFSLGKSVSGMVWPHSARVGGAIRCEPFDFHPATAIILLGSS